MSKFNRPTARPTLGRTPITSETAPSGYTYEGAPGYARDSRSALFLLAISNMVSEDTFYESAIERDQRYVELVRRLAVSDPYWLANMLTWLRQEANMRSAALVGAAEAVRARLIAGEHGLNRALIEAVLARADEPGELLAYWTSRYGRSLPMPVKRGVATAARRLYNEFTLLKYDTESHAFRFGDVIELCHPRPIHPGDSHQSDLFRYAIDRRRGRGTEIPYRLTKIRRNAELRRWAAREPEVLLDPVGLRDAGMTWEDVLSLAGGRVDKRRLWEAIIPTMGYMALLRNLRNFDGAGVSDEVAAQVADRLADPDQIVRSRQFPFRFLAAYRTAPSLRWGYALEKALDTSLANIPKLSGRTLVLVDRSNSMNCRMSKRSDLTRGDAATVFGVALALRNVGRVTLVEFGTTSREVPVNQGDSMLRLVNQFGWLGGTYLRQATNRHYNGHDRVVVITDEQTHDGGAGDAVPGAVPVYVFNLGGYRHGVEADRPNRVTIGGGLTDAAFQFIQLLEHGQAGRWPWEQPEG